MNAFLAFLGYAIAIVTFGVAWWWHHTEEARRRVTSRTDLVKRWGKAADAAEQALVAFSWTVGKSPSASEEERDAWKDYLKVMEAKTAFEHPLFRLPENLTGAFERRIIPESLAANLRKHYADIQTDSCEFAREPKRNWLIRIGDVALRVRTGDSGSEVTRVFDWRILAPAQAARIQTLFERKNAGARIRVSDEVSRTDMRYQISDTSLLILNFPSDTPEMASETGLPVKQRVLIDALKAAFERVWTDPKTKGFDEFVEASILALLPVDHTLGGRTARTLSEQLDLDKNPRVAEQLCEENLARLIENGAVHKDGLEYYRGP